jgi:hypothetical protein
MDVLFLWLLLIGYFLFRFAYRFFLFVPFIIGLSIAFVELLLRRWQPGLTFKTRCVLVTVLAVTASTAFYGPEWIGKAIFFYRCENDELYASSDAPAPGGLAAIIKRSGMAGWPGCGSYCQELLLEGRVDFVEIATYRVKRYTENGGREFKLVGNVRYTASRGKAACSHAITERVSRTERINALADYASRGICIKAEEVADLMAPYVLETAHEIISALPETFSRTFSVRRQVDGVVVGRAEVRIAKPGWFPPLKQTKDYRVVRCPDGKAFYLGERQVLNDVFDLGLDGRLQSPTPSIIN